MAAPQGMWECPQCGDYVDNSESTCPHCSVSPFQTTSSASSNPWKAFSSVKLTLPSIPPQSKWERVVQFLRKVVAILSQFFHLAGVIAAIALMIYSVSMPTPVKHLRVSSYSTADWDNNYGEAYVGGDAYNYQMEASLKAGYMSGVMATKSITFVGGVMLLFVTLYSYAKCNAIDKQTALLTSMNNVLAQRLPEPEKKEE